MPKTILLWNAHAPIKSTYFTNKLCIFTLFCRNDGAVTPKLVPPKIGLAGLILAEKPAKTGPPDHFCCQNRSPLPKLVPPQKVTLINFMRVHDCMDV